LIALDEILEQEVDNISAFIVEPLVQGAGSMHMYHEEYLVGARYLTKKYNIHLIVDEIMTGFGRTGTMFASEYAGIEPDFMTLSKGLTGGYLPLSVVMTTNQIYDAFYCDYNEYRAFLHSHSYTGNTLACAAALATLEIFEEEKTIDKNISLNHYMKQKLERFDGLKNVKSTRILGMIAVVELSDIDKEKRIGLQISQYALSRGVLLRPLGNTIYVMPPFVITNDELDIVFDVIYDAVNKL
jgi:adenosylmethionine-8-amino-7-oxononanoate aminotransferase